jgi:hypothetical protein
MYPRRFTRLAVAGATFAAGLAFAAPAPAAPAGAPAKYNPETKIGFVSSGDVRKAFGWSGATLESRAPGLIFDHEFWTDDTYSVLCGTRTFPIVHHRVFGRYELTDAVTHDGYGDLVLGFRISGARFGISGTSVAPAAGQPCPEDQAPGTTMDAVTLVSSATGWALTVTSDSVRRELLVKEAPSRR